MLSDFYRGESKIFYGTITYNGSNPDISSDTITLIMKANKDDTDANAVLNVTGSVEVSGSAGRYDYTITPTQTDITPSQYFYEIVWNTAGGNEFVLEQSNIKVKERVEDV